MTGIKTNQRMLHKGGRNSCRKSASNPEETVAAFREEYLRCGAVTMENYDRKQSKGAWGSATVIKRAGVQTWRELLGKAGLQGWQPSARKGIEAYTLTMHFVNEDRPAEWNRKMGALNYISQQPEIKLPLQSSVAQL